MMLNKYFAVFKINFLNNFVYLADAMLNQIMSCIYVLIFIFLWTSASKSNDLAGYTLASVIWYLGISQVIISAQGKTVKDVSGDINSGNISNYLNKPYSYIGYQLSYFLGDAVISFFTSFFWVGLLVWFYFGLPPIELKYLPFIALVILLGILVNFFVMLSIGFLAFWFEDATPYSWIYDKIVFILGGMLLPLEFMPSFAQSIAKILPTAFVMYFPAKVFVAFNFELFFEALLGQILYFVLFFFISYFLFKKGCKKVSINGG